MENHSRSAPISTRCLIQMMIGVIVVLVISRTKAATNKLVVPSNAQCACHDDLLTFTCTVIGPGNTIWTGTAFNCPMSNNEIILPHSQFVTRGTFGSCGTKITARSLRNETNSFISELNITVDASVSNKSVECQHNSVDPGTVPVDRETVSVISATNPYPSPISISLININQTHVIFNWTSATSCSSVEYVISSDCGTCPHSTNTTSATCTNRQRPTGSDTVICNFAVSSMVCGVTGNSNTSVTLAIPDIPKVNIIPGYVNNSQKLQQLFLEITMNETTVINNDISGSVTSYNVVFSTNTLMDAVTITAVPCEDGVCNYQVNVPSHVCSASTDVNVTVLASNKIGEGRPSDTVAIGCTNEFVHLKFDSNTSTFFCIFINELDDSGKFCKIDYGMCGQELMKSVQGYPTMDNPIGFSVMLPEIKAETYCYIVTAGNNIATVKINGTVMKDAPFMNNTSALVIGIVTSVVIIILIIIIIVVVIIIIGLQYQKKKVVHTDGTDAGSDHLKPVDGQNFKVYEVEQSCELREFIFLKKPEIIKSWRGKVFYQFTCEKENILSENTKLIFQDKKNTRNFYEPAVALSQMGLLGEGITIEKFDDKYRVFVQSKGSGARHLATGSYLLYVHDEQVTSDTIQYIPVPKAYFATKIVDREGITLKEFCKMQHILDKETYNIFLDVDGYQPESVVYKDDELLMDKQNGGLFVVPFAHQHITKIDRQKWRVFRVCKSKNALKLKKGMMIIYEDPNYISRFFHVLAVDEDNVRLSEFVRKKLDSFESGKAFFEFTQAEYLPWCRKMIRMSTGKQEKESDYETFQASITTFYEFPGAPGEEVQPKSTKDFIHSQSHGSRCLKKGTLLLYNCEYLGSKEPEKTEGKTTGPKCETTNAPMTGKMVVQKEEVVEGKTSNPKQKFQTNDEPTIEIEDLKSQQNGEKGEATGAELELDEYICTPGIKVSAN